MVKKAPITPADTTVMLLAAGRGKRMRDLTENCPKPLLKVGQDSLIEHHLSRLAVMGFRHVVINIAYLGEQIRDALGNGEQFGLDIRYSDESQRGALETAGGILYALDKIESDPFITINADIWTDFEFDQLPYSESEACLVVVENPSHNPTGDFFLSDDGTLHRFHKAQTTSLTFSGIAIYHKAFFNGLKPGKTPLAPVFFQKIKEAQLCAMKHTGEWTDVGTPERLIELNSQQALKQGGDLPQ